MFLSSAELDAAEALLRHLVPHHIVPWSVNEKRREKVKGQLWITLIVLSFMMLLELSSEHMGSSRRFASRVDQVHTRNTRFSRGSHLLHFKSGPRLYTAATAARDC